MATFDKEDVAKIAKLEEKVHQLEHDVAEKDREIKSLMDWKAECENTNKILIKLLMAISAIATGIGVWLENIKASLRGALKWLTM